MKNSPHDKLFKEAFGSPRNAAAQLRTVLPSGMIDIIDLDSLTPLPGNFRDVALAESSSDLLFSVRIQARPALMYFLFEHKSTADRWVAFQLLRYMVRIWERCRQENPQLERLPPIVPVVVHHSDRGWGASTSFADLVEPIIEHAPELSRFVPHFEYLLDDITYATDEQLRSRALDAFGVLALLFLRDARSPRRFLGAFASWADLIRELRDAPDGARALGSSSGMFPWLRTTSTGTNSGRSSTRSRQKPRKLS